MTCTVGIVHEGYVWIGSDSAASNGYAVTLRRDPKVWRVGEFVIGIAGSFRMADLLRYRLEPPPLPDGEDLHRYMATAFVDAIRTLFKDGGFGQQINGEDCGGQFLVGIRGRLFHIDPDFQVGEKDADYDAIGAGAPYALGALHYAPGDPPLFRLTRALEAAVEHADGVRRPFVIASTKDATAPLRFP